MQRVDELVMLSRDRIIVSDMNPIGRSDGVTSPLAAKHVGEDLQTAAASLCLSGLFAICTFAKLRGATSLLSNVAAV